jgi:hypothetical protein
MRLPRAINRARLALRGASDAARCVALFDLLEALLKPRKIIVEVEGGVVQSVRNIPRGIVIEIRDFDTDGAEENTESAEQLVEFDGQNAIVSKWEAK